MPKHKRVFKDLVKMIIVDQELRAKDNFQNRYRSYALLQQASDPASPQGARECTREVWRGNGLSNGGSGGLIPQE